MLFFKIKRNQLIEIMDNKEYNEFRRNNRLLRLSDSSTIYPGSRAEYVYLVRRLYQEEHHTKSQIKEFDLKLIEQKAKKKQKNAKILAERKVYEQRLADKTNVKKLSKRSYFIESQRVNGKLICCHCGRTDLVNTHTNNHDWSATIDHVIPKSLQGKNHPSNYAIACAPCNTKRGSGPFYKSIAPIKNPVKIRTKRLEAITKPGSLYYDFYKQNYQQFQSVFITIVVMFLLKLKLL